LSLILGVFPWFQGGMASAKAFATRSRTMLRLNETQRTLVAEKLCDAGNLAAGALTFAQFLAERSSAPVALGGLLLWFLFMGCALRLAGRTER
jgi:hypothetical protein